MDLGGDLQDALSSARFDFEFSAQRNGVLDFFTGFAELSFEEQILTVCGRSKKRRSESCQRDDESEGQNPVPNCIGW